MDKIKSLIVEDEPAAREALKAYLAKYCPTVEVLSEAKNSMEAVSLVHILNPDLIFLDVEMPYGNAFDVLEQCKDLSFETIFVTAFSNYSIRALNLSAAYYLLKPVNIEELIQAVAKVQQQLLEKHRINRHEVILQNLRASHTAHLQVILPTLEGFEVVKAADIVRLRGNGNFTDLFLAGGQKKMVCRFLKHFEEMLPAHFVRVHKSNIVNTHYVAAYHKGSGGYITMSNGHEVEVSSSYKEAFLRAFTT